MKVFSAFIAWLHRLKYPQKFTLITLLFVLPLAAFYPLVAEQNQRIQDYGVKEFYGTLYLRPLEHLLRDAIQYELTLNGSNASPISLVQAQIESDFQALQQIDGQYGAVLQASARSADLAAEWRDLQETAATMDPPTRAGRQKKFIEHIRALISHVGDTSFLILDPDLDTYYMMDTVLLKLPDYQNILLETLILGKDIIQHQALTEDQRTQLIILTGLLQSNLSMLENNVRTAYKNNPSGTMQTLSEAPLQAYLAAANRFLDLTETHLLNTTSIDLSLTDFTASANEALKTNDVFYDAASQALEGGVQARRQKLTRQVIFTLTVPAVSIVVAFVIGLLLMLSISRPLSNLAEATQRLALGEMGARVTATSGDEIGQVGLAFNDMAQELQNIHASLEQRVVERTAQLQAANKEMEAFTYSVSHDLRAPLRAVHGFSQALLNKYAGALDDQGKHYLSRIQENTSRMGQLIDDLLSLARISRREMKHDLVNLSELAREIAAELKAQEPERQVVFEIEGQVEGRGDAGLIRDVLQNLLGNAWKFTSTRAQAQIQFGIARPSPAGRGMSIGQGEGETVYFVKDNGAGFDMAYANKLFGAFQRLHSTDEFPGTGIGLATVQRIIHRHGGRIWAEAESEKGAAFYFTLGMFQPPPRTS